MARDSSSGFKCTHLTNSALNSVTCVVNNSEAPNVKKKDMKKDSKLYKHDKIWFKTDVFVNSGYLFICSAIDLPH